MRSNRTNGKHEFAPGNFTNYEQSPGIQFVSASNAAKLEGSNPLSAGENARKTPASNPAPKKIIAGRFSKKTGFFILRGIAMLSLSSALIVKKNHKHLVEQNIVQATTSTLTPAVNDVKPTEEKIASAEEKEKLVRKNWREYIHVNNSNYAYV